MRARRRDDRIGNWCSRLSIHFPRQVATAGLKRIHVVSSDNNSKQLQHKPVWHMLHVLLTSTSYNLKVTKKNELSRHQKADAVFFLK